MEKQFIQAVNRHYSMVDLLSSHFGINARVGATLLCPFHVDSRKSAKLYEDNAVYCFTESKMFRPYNLLRFVGRSDEQIANSLPVEARNFKVSEPESSISLVDVSALRIVYMKTGDLEAAVNTFYSKFGKVKNG